MPARAATAALALLLTACSSAGPGAEGTARTPGPEAAEEQLAPGPTLAQLDRNPDAAPAYTGIIADLDDHCVSGGPVDLANLAVVTRNVLEDEGVSATHLEVLRGIRDSVPPDAPRLDCDEVATAWATLMIRGQ